MKDIIINGCHEIGVEISGEQADMLVTYARMLVEWNEKMNLTAITEESDIAKKHFLDSITAISTGCIGEKGNRCGNGRRIPGAGA